MLSLQEYEKFLAELNAAGVRSRTVASVKSIPPRVGTLILKHDVETNVKMAYLASKIEAKLNHKATYYIQGSLCRKRSVRKYMKKMHELGHEVTLHYDVLDSNNGDYILANKEFSELHGLFETLGIKISSVCPHGNPTKIREGWRSNKDFFRSEQIRAQYKHIIDIVVDFPTLFPRGTYLSDAGFSLRKIGDIANNDFMYAVTIIA